MKINELVDVWDDRDIDNRDGETELALKNIDPTMHIKLKKFYNWDASPFDEILYFYFRDKRNKKMMAISFGWNDYLKDDVYMIHVKEFTYDDRGILFHDDKGDDPWELYEKDIQPSDADSLFTIFKNIFEAKEVDLQKGALSYVQGY